MASLSEENRAKTLEILDEVRRRISAAAGDDSELVFQMRRLLMLMSRRSTIGAVVHSALKRSQRL